MTAERYPRDLPPFWFVCAVGVMFALHHAAPVAVIVPAPWHKLGWVLLTIGGLIALPSLLGFRRAGTSIKPFQPVRALVADGPYRFTRNPMYLALVTMAFGVAVRLGSLSPLLVPPALFLVLDQRFVRREERFLRANLGTAYDDYCGRVRRWL
ncbi:MAG: isoprenylcysteine carboxylmethyltransferase family protein [Planctomycetes bacterium]|nr:isoprenylcysteine carboxylmethyltransferase family protein [Planctomycetota bacterium]